MSDDENVKRLPVRFKSPAPADRTLLFPHEINKSAACSHYDAYIVDDANAEVECAKCGAKLNPMWVLKRLCAKENTFHESAKRYREEMERLAKRSRTKCDRCGHMTRISRS
jgi:ribosomal protein S27E